MEAGMYRFVAILTALLLLAGLLFGGTTGKLSGTVRNAETGKPLSGANVYIEGTRLGAATDLNGDFYIINIPAGRYTVTTSSMGYQSVTVRNILITADFTTKYDFELSTEILEAGKEVVIVAERPLVETDRTSSVRVSTAEEIENLPVRGYRDVVALQSGVVEHEYYPGDARQGERTQGSRLQIRGGRPEEVGYWVDGFSQTDPQTGFSTTAINNTAIQEVILMTGGFSAEYGKIMSGAVNVITKSGTDSYSGSFEAVTDNFINDDVHRMDYNVYAASLGGPIIPGDDRFTFYLSGERRWQRDRAPKYNTRDMNRLYLEIIGENPDDATYRLPGNSLSGWTYQGKLKFRVSDAITLDLGTLGSEDDWSEFRQWYLFDISHTPRYLDRNASAYGKVTHTLSKSTFYTAAVNYYYTERIRGDGELFDNLLDYARVSNPSYDAMTLFMRGESDTTVQVITAIDTVTGDTTFADSTIYREHVWDDYLHRESSYIGFDFDITHQLTTHHQLKMGFDIQRHTLKYWRHLFPVYQFALDRPYADADSNGIDDNIEFAYLDVDYFGYSPYDPDADYDADLDVSGLNDAKHPITMAIYLQDKVEYEGLVINAGVRYDLLDTDTKRLRNEEYPLDPDQTGLDSELTESDLEDADVQHKVSPRLGIGFPITDRTVVHFSYGKFFQQPNLNDLYVSYDYLEHKIQTGGYYYPFGNPNLKPETTTAYEVGFTQQMGENVRFDVTAYYKDIKDLVQTKTISSFPNNFASYRNTDFGTVKGIDFNITMRRTHNFSANVSYGLMWATGTGSASSTQSNIAWTADDPPKMTAPLDFDQRHKVSLNVDYRLGEDSGPMLGNIYPFENAGINVVFNAGSGLPYTPEEVWNEVTLGAISPTPTGPINSRRGPWTWRMDLKANRTFMFNRLAVDVYLWVLNLFNTQNMIDVYASSGMAGTTGWLSTPDGQAFLANPNYPENSYSYYRLAELDPTRYGIPRQVRIGMMLSF
jgi:outer membrane receptor protein involved in Fe transport